MNSLFRLLLGWVWLGLSGLLAVLASWVVPVIAQSGSVSWRPPFTLSNTLQASQNPAIVSDNFGYVHVFWSEDMGGAPFEDQDNAQEGNSILYTRWDGQSWTPPVDILYMPGESIANYVAVHVDANNQLHAVWEGQRNFYYSNAPSWRADSAQAWAKPIVIATNSARSRWTSSITTDASGKLHIVYATRDAEEGVYHIVSQDGGLTWDAPIKLSEPLDLLERSFSNVQIVADSAGRLHVVWQTNQIRGYGQAIYYSRSVDGGQTWSSPLQLRSRGSDDTFVELPFLATRGDSELHLIYVNGTNVGRAHRISRDGGATWSEPRTILTELEGINGYVFPLIDGAGQMHLIINMRTRDQRSGGIFYAHWLGDDWSRVEPLVVGSANAPNPNEASAHWTVGTVRLGSELHLAWLQLEKSEIGYVSGTVASVAPFLPSAVPLPLPSTPVPSATAGPNAPMPTPHPTRVQLSTAARTPAAANRVVANPLPVAVSASLLLVVGVVLWTRLHHS